MFALVSIIAARLQGALGASWHVAEGIEPHDRRPLPRALVLMEAPDVSSTSGPGVNLAPRYVVQMVAEASSSAAFEQLDAAMDAVIGLLHNWRPEPAAHRCDRLRLQAARDLQAVEQCLFGFELLFTTTTIRQGYDAE